MNEQAHALDVKEVFHWFGANKVLDNINFEVSPGQIVAVVGPSGCGKSTRTNSMKRSMLPIACSVCRSTTRTETTAQRSSMTDHRLYFTPAIHETLIDF